MDKKLERLKHMIEESNYTVAMSGSGMLDESGSASLKDQSRAYDIEEKYGSSPEDIFTSAYYNTRAEQFFHFLPGGAPEENSRSHQVRRGDG